MRATLKRYFDALIARREEGKDEGFSLIELIVVVAILGILVAVAIPVFGNIQTSAKENSLKTIAANAVTSAASQYTAGSAASPAAASLTALASKATPAEYTIAVTGTTLDNICATVTGAAGQFAGVGAQKSGPGCS